MHPNSLHDCALVVVLFHTTPQDHLARLAPIAAQGVRVVLVDNTPAGPDAQSTAAGRLPEHPRITHIPLGRNAGIAHALNVGIESAFAAGATHVFTIDQDSEVTVNLLASLLTRYKMLEQQGQHLLALGPHPVNKVTGASYLRRRDRLRVWLSAPKSPPLLQVSEIITSGLLANRETFIVAGGYDTSLFIDFVDHDWCWRLRRMGGHCAVDLTVPLPHMVGQGDVPFTFGMKRGAAGRIFFLFRNGVFLTLRGRMPLFDAIKFLMLLPAKFLVFGLMPDRKKRWRQMGHGLCEGVKMAFRTASAEQAPTPSQGSK